MAINLVKGQTIDLRKKENGDNYDLSQVTIGLGWDIRKQHKGLLGSLLGSKEADYDLDAIAFLLDAQGKIVNQGQTVTLDNGRNRRFHQGDIIFFNSKQHSSGHIWLTGDNRTGAGEGDDEQIIVKLDDLDHRYQRIVFLVTIYRGKANGQHFGLVENAFIRAVDNTGQEIARYSLSGETNQGLCSLIFAEVYRKEGTWKFRALGEGYTTDNFSELMERYI